MRNRPAALARPVLFDIVVGEIDDRAQQVEGNIEIARGFTHNGQVENGTVIGQQHPVAVVDQPAVGRHVLGMEAVAVGAGREIIVAVDLEIDHPGDESTDEEEYKDTGDNHAPVENQGLPFMIIQLELFCHLSSQCR